MSLNGNKKLNRNEMMKEVSKTRVTRPHCEKNNWKTVETGEQLVDLSFYPYFLPECS